MKIPKALEPLIEDGVIDEVIRSLKSGKEASVYVVRCGSEIRCAKVYKDMGQRSFQQRAQYQEGRKVRGSRQARAMRRSTRFGRKEQETAWKNTEVDALYQLAAAGVRVPVPLRFLQRRAAHGAADRCRRPVSAGPGRGRALTRCRRATITGS